MLRYIRIACRYIKKYPQRSMAMILSIALSTFLIVAIGSLNESAKNSQVLYAKNYGAQHRLSLVMNSLFFIRGIREASGSVPWHGFIAGNIALVIILIIVNILLFLGMVRYIVDKLDRLSAAMDKLMEGEYASFPEEKEGMFSRLDSPFSRVSRKMERGFESLRKGKEDLQSLVTDLSHQIKTPLSAVKVFYALLSEDDLSPQERREFSDRLREQIDKLEWLSDGLIKISKMETGMI